MAIDEPSEAFGLWPRVKALSGWPDNDETRMGDLATAWQQSGGAFTSAAGTDVGALRSGWPDSAGTAFLGRTDELGRVTEQTAELMRQLGAKAAHFAAVVTEVKKGIWTLIEENIDGFGRTFPLADGVREAVQNDYVQRIAAAVNKLINAGAEAVGEQGSVTAAVRQLGDIVKGVQDNVREDLTDKWFLAAGDAAGGAAGTLAAHRFAKMGTDLGFLTDDVKQLIGQERLNMKFGGALAGVGFVYDVVNGKPVDQAFVSNGAGFLASVAMGAAVGSLIPVPVLGTAAGALAGALAGIYTSGMVDSLYENGVGEIGQAISDGAEAVGEFGGAIGDVAGDVWDAIF